MRVMRSLPRMCVEESQIGRKILARVGKPRNTRRLSVSGLDGLMDAELLVFNGGFQYPQVECSCARLLLYA
jgi:hypothetical protein